MLIAKAARTDLLHLGVRTWETLSVDAIPAPVKDACVLVWHHKLGTMPDVVVVEDGGLQSFFAWTTTYAPHLTPITALLQVVEFATFVNVPSAGVGEGLRSEREPAFSRGCLGLVHAEVVAAFQGVSAPLNTGLTPHVSTFSWLAFQHQRATAHRSPLQKLRETWDEARRLLDARRLSYVSEDVEEVWSLITDSDVGSGPKQNDQVRQIATFLESVDAGTPAIDALNVAKEHDEELNALQSGPLEGRVEVFRKLLRALYEKRNPPGANALLAGYAVSQISQGSFSHVGLLGPGRVSDVRPILWYGWFDFCRRNPEPAAPAVGSASLQLLKTLHAPCSTWPRRDIAIEELRVLSRQKDPFAECLLDLRHPIGVEIAPGLVSVIQPGKPRGPDAGQSRHSQRSLFNE